VTLPAEMERQLRDVLRRLDVLATVEDYTIPAGETHYLPDKTTDPAAAKGVDVKEYSKKTLSFLFDADLNYEVQVSDDRTNWIKMYAADGVRSAHPWFQADCLYVRLKVQNPLATDQKVVVCTFKARRLG